MAHGVGAPLDHCTAKLSIAQAMGGAANQGASCSHAFSGNPGESADGPTTKIFGGDSFGTTSLLISDILQYGDCVAILSEPFDTLRANG